jgi:hypothetical protein
MINDKLRLVDGFRGLPGGMDGSQDPVLTPETSVYYAENVVFRGGAGPRTRPGFKFINLYEFSGSPGLVTGAVNLQGAFVFTPSQFSPKIILVLDGQLVSMDVVGRKIEFIKNPSGELDFNLFDPVYFCQVEDFLVVQNGKEPPKVVKLLSNGNLVQEPSYLNSKHPIPIGKQMSYGHGRLFVTNTNGREITAGDIAFGGSTTSVEILSSSDDDQAVLTSSAPHGLLIGDYVTISGHSSLPAINGTFKVESVPALDKFSISAAVGVPGSGGQATKFNAGVASDALNFSETNFINEGGNLLVPAEMGLIKSMEFLPVQDVSTGQGDLLVFCERGAASFAVSIPREKWKETENFQRVLFSGIGAVSDSTCVINGDVFFRSLQGNGLRSYRNARAEFQSFGQAPISSEMDPVFSKEDVSLLGSVSMIYFDDRLLVTCKPAKESGTLIYKGILALDYRPTAGNSIKSSAAYDGVWSGLKVFKLLSGVFEGQPRAFALCYGERGTEFWEITKDGLNDETYNGPSRIKALVLTKAYDFKKPFSEKKAIHCDLWFSDIGGNSQNKFNSTLHYRPDANPNWSLWKEWDLCFSDAQPNALRGYAPRLRAEVPSAEINSFTNKSLFRGYDFKLRVEWEGRARLEKMLIHSLELVEGVGVGAIDPPTCVLVSQQGPGNETGYESSAGDGPTRPVFYLLINEIDSSKLLLNETSTAYLLLLI